MGVKWNINRYAVEASGSIIIKSFLYVQLPVPHRQRAILTITIKMDVLVPQEPSNS